MKAPVHSKFSPSSKEISNPKTDSSLGLRSEPSSADHSSSDELGLPKFKITRDSEETLSHHDLILKKNLEKNRYDPSELYKTRSMIRKLADTIHDRYEKACRPPGWQLDLIEKDGRINDESDKSLNISTQWFFRAQNVFIYVNASSIPDKASLGVLRSVVSTREPVCIGDPETNTVLRPYKDPQESGYTKHFRETGTLAPNFAVYMRALFTSKTNSLHKPFFRHVINCIGYAFDVTDQPDFQVLADPYREPEMVRRVTDIFRLVFACGRNLDNCTSVCLCYIGGGAFAEKFPGDYRSVFLQALNNVSLKDVAHFSEISIMGIENEFMTSLGEAVRKTVTTRFKKKCNLLGRIPDIFIGRKDMLFMNAWDPHSIVGNGNKCDDSLDGYFGRYSDMAYMSLPAVNPFMLHNIVVVKE